MSGNHREMAVAVVDDDAGEREQLSGYIIGSGWDKVEGFSSGEDFLKSFSLGKYGMIFMDIYMGGQTGVETVQRIRVKDPKVYIAFVSSSADYAMEAYRLHVNRYIEKPFDRDEVRDILEEAERAKESARNSATIDFGESIRPVQLENIVCIEQRAHMAVLYLSDGSTVMIRKKISDLIRLFEGRRSFYQCHRSFIINVAHVQGIDEELQVFSTDIGKNVHIRRGELGKAKRTLTQYRLDKTRSI